MSRAHHSGAQPSQRMLRVAELVRHAVANLIARGAVNDPVIETHVVTVPRVQMSPDLKLATVYVMPLGGKDVDEVLAALDRNKKFLRAEVAHQVNLRFAPDVRFKADTTFDNAARIDALLRAPEVRRDLVKKDNAG
jgi:ribosome-binding factor A